MKKLSAGKITSVIAQLCIDINCNVDSSVIRAIKKACRTEESPAGRDILKQVLENDRLAAKEQVAACQDTGIVIVFAKLGQGLRIEGDFNRAINEGVRRGYRKGYLRKSVVEDPLKRKNTADNTPAIIHVEIVPGNSLELSLMAKGAGSENMSRLAMLAPSEGEEGIIEFVVEAVKSAGANPCPPIIVGVGVGGTFESVAELAKKALLRPLNTSARDRKYARMEKEILRRINNLGIGPQGLGGRVTALAVHVDSMACHIASMPVAVNINCHISRHGTIVLKGR